VFASFIGCGTVLIVGFATCSDESSSCPGWHEWSNTIAFCGTAASFLALIVLFLMIVSDWLYRAKGR
jgi:hypothetical protein